MFDDESSMNDSRDGRSTCYSDTDQNQPSSSNNSNSSESMIAKALGEMSLVERDTVYQDIHGVTPQVDENSDLIETKVAQLHSALEQHVNLAPGDAFVEAWTLNPSFVRSRKLALSFLRAETFNVKLAAERMIRYFAWKKKLFGASKLCRNICIGDLDEQDLELLKRGDIQKLPERDQAGRAIVFIAPNGAFEYPPLSFVSVSIVFGYSPIKLGETCGLTIAVFSTVPSAEFGIPYLQETKKQRRKE